MSKRENRIPVMMSDEELKAVDDWRFENRVATRSDAVRRLCSLASAMGLIPDDIHTIEQVDAFEESKRFEDTA